ncbi:MAG: DegT/DnrJ/EryC1/StrS family aminotransferase [Flavobacteriales bacterium]|nr:DegT/DnrJ/EryC1/StrS family aminotransferase [Flavobacteriales bacterium]
MHNIPFSPPRVDDRTVEAVTEVLRSGWITTGPKTAQFETELAEYIGVDKVLALNSWTNACELVLRWFGVGEGDEVILPAYTYAATANIVMHVGATPVLVDSLPDHCHINPHAIAEAVTERTKVIMPVDIGGMPVDYDGIWSVINDKKSLFRPNSSEQKKLGRILFLSDAAHSFGAKYKGKQIGQQADISGYSFHAVKNLTTAEGGALAFNLQNKEDNEELYRRLRISALHGQTKDALSKTDGNWRYDIIEAGFKCNMTDIQAAMGLVELSRYDETLACRKSICERYDEAFIDGPFIIPPQQDDDRETSYHLYQLRLRNGCERDRDALIDALREQGISSNVHFQPLPLLSFYREQGYHMSDYPNAWKAYENEISLPVWYGMTREMVARVSHAVQELWRG